MLLTMMVRSFITFVLLFAFAVPAAYAQDLFIGEITGQTQKTPKKKSDEKKSEVENPYKYLQNKKNTGMMGKNDPLIPTRTFYLSFIRNPEGNIQQKAILRMSQPLSVSGCVNITLPEPTISVNGSTMWIKTEEPIIEVAGKGVYGNHECTSSHQNAVTDIALDLPTIKENNIWQIAFQNKYAIDPYRVEITDHKISLIPKSPTYHKPAEHSQAMTHWIYPAGTVIVSIPGAREGEDFTADLKKVIAAKELKPLNTIIKDFSPPQTIPNSFYVVDRDDQYADTLQDTSGVSIGFVERMETFYGPEGPYKKAKKLDVIARRPNILE